MPSGKSIEDMGDQIPKAAQALAKRVQEQFTGMGPYTHQIKDSEFPQWFEMMRSKALEEQLQQGIIGWTFPDGSTVPAPLLWDRVLNSPEVEGGRTETRRYERLRFGGMNGD